MKYSAVFLCLIIAGCVSSQKPSLTYDMNRQQIKSASDEDLCLDEYRDRLSDTASKELSLRDLDCSPFIDKLMREKAANLPDILLCSSEFKGPPEAPLQRATAIEIKKRDLDCKTMMAKETQ